MEESEYIPKFLQNCPEGNSASINQRFYCALRILRKECPAEYPIKVRRVELKDNFALCHLVNTNKQKSKRYFLIKVDINLDYGQLIDSIMHEWAHALTWDLPTSKDHGRSWSDAYGRIYRILIED